jgi:hypothetical protein
VPGDPTFTWYDVNYAPILTGGVLLAITVWWYASARYWFKGPIRTIDASPPATEAPAVAKLSL